MLQTDLNPIIDEGAPRSIGGIIEAARLADVLGLELEVTKQKANYVHGLGTDCSNAKPVVCSWDFTVPDATGCPTTLTFDLFDGSAPLIIGLDLKRFSDT